MKTLSCLLLLAAIAAFGLMGCSDKSDPIAQPTGPSVGTPGDLAKSIQREFTWTAASTSTTDPGTLHSPQQGNKLAVKKRIDQATVMATFTDGGPDLLSGNGVVELNGMADLVAGTGDFYGKLTLTPTAAAAEGGTWEFTWHGKATLDPGTMTWILPLKEVGHGSGGALTGMQCFVDHVITAKLDFSSWTGAASGYIATH